jgi:hypothetical protein
MDRSKFRDENAEILTHSSVVIPSQKKPADPSAQQSVILDCSYIKESFKKFQSFQPF